MIALKPRISASTTNLPRPRISFSWGAFELSSDMALLRGVPGARPLLCGARCERCWCRPLLRVPLPPSHTRCARRGRHVRLLTTWKTTTLGTVLKHAHASADASADLPGGTAADKACVAATGSRGAACNKGSGVGGVVARLSASKSGTTQKQDNGLGGHRKQAANRLGGWVMSI